MHNVVLTGDAAEPLPPAVQAELSEQQQEWLDHTLQGLTAMAGSLDDYMTGQVVAAGAAAAHSAREGLQE